MCGATIPQSPAPYWSRLHIGGGACAAPRREWTVRKPICQRGGYLTKGVPGRLHIRGGSCAAPRFLKVRRRTWAGSVLEPAIYWGRTMCGTTLSVGDKVSERDRDRHKGSGEIVHLPAPYLVRLYIRSGPCTAPATVGVAMQLQLMIRARMRNFLKSGAVLGPAPYRTHPMYGATISESPAPYLVRLHIGPVPCTAPAIPGVVGHA